MKKLLSKNWIKGLIIFLPFTGIIDPVWYVILLVAYFVGMVVYLMNND